MDRSAVYLLLIRLIQESLVHGEAEILRPEKFGFQMSWMVEKLELENVFTLVCLCVCDDL